jgi:hypothetical protein
MSAFLRLDVDIFTVCNLDVDIFTVGNLDADQTSTYISVIVFTYNALWSVFKLVLRHVGT